jgi:hypothetical protein
MFCPASIRVAVRSGGRPDGSEIVGTVIFLVVLFEESFIDNCWTQPLVIARAAKRVITTKNSYSGFMDILLRYY